MSADEKINHDPYSSEVMPSGNLRVQTFGRSAEGEIWDGVIEVTPEHPSYLLWLTQINDKEAYHAARAEERRQAREQRRQRRQP